MCRLKVLIAPDKFKGTLSARAAAEAIGRGWTRARPNDSLDLLPITDGGDGFAETMGMLLGGKAVVTHTIDAAHRPCQSKWWWRPKTKMAIIESAAAIGLAMLPPKRFHPFELDTYGLGRLMHAAARKGATQCLIGIGGSATNDGGFGLGRSLGWKFLDGNGRSIERWTDLLRLQRIVAPSNPLPFKQLVVAVDVENPLLGKRGATRVYGPQKGLRAVDFAVAEQCLRRLARVVKSELGIDLAKLQGSGAAGGLGFGLAAFAGGDLEPGFHLFARQSNLDQRLRQADLVITGEGCVDHSTLMGKGVGQVAKRCLALKIRCVALAGVAESRRNLLLSFDRVHTIRESTSRRQALSRADYWLARLAEQIAYSV